LCGKGVTSFIELTLIPAFCIDLIAVSRPGPGPLTKTDMVFIPNSSAFFAASSAAIWAAKGVPFLVPLKPFFPAAPHDKTFPDSSVIVIIVLLKVA
jgi:hypothetical protein